jgi:SpoVK/Ycf46/Vps4 family AAA+-type ATPase
MRQRIIHYLRAGYAGLYLVSPEEQRVEAEFKGIAEELGFRLHVWSATAGLLDVTSRSIRDCNDPMAVLLAVTELPDKAIILLRDFHAFLAGDPNPILVRQFKEVLQAAKTKNKALVLVGCRLCLPPELERELTVIEFALPGKDELASVLHGVLESAQQDGIKLAAATAEQEEALLGAASGLTTIEAENAFALSVVETKALDPVIIAREKAQAVKKSGLLELVETKESLDSIGGLDMLKSWLVRRKHAFSQKARDYGLPTPKGLLIMGIPGTGKSLTAKATAAVFGTPLLLLDAGRIFGGLVGQSESNIRSVIQTAEAIAPCVLWLDEVEKGLAGSKSSGVTDGGTSARVFGSFISWMAEKTAPVFVVATANDVSQLPPELLRKGRWDELFFVDLPNQEERQEIWRIQVAKHGRDWKDYDIAQLAKATDGLTGSEIEAVFVEALYRAFDDDQEPTDLTVAEVLTDFVPLSKTMAEQITGLRSWAKGRARLATSPQTERRLRKLAA